jgi:hypothetical protein
MYGSTRPYVPLLGTHTASATLCTTSSTGSTPRGGGAFGSLYEVDDEIRLVTVLRVGHRADIYRPR